MSSELRVNKLTSRSGVGTVTFNDSGLIITGIATAATLDITGNATIAGVLSYDDVTNVDSVGLVTARSGIKLGATGSNTLISGTATGIGIGTESPDRKLEVVNDDDYALKVGGNTSGGYYLELGQTGTNGSAGIKYSGSGGSLKISNSSGEIARFDPSGNMGLGTNNPSFSQFGSNTGGLAVEDVGTSNTGIKIGDGSNDNYLVAAGNGSFYLSHYGSGSMIFGAGSSGDERLRIDSSGRLLINHTADTAAGGYASKLQVCDTSYQGSSISLRRDGGTGGPALVFGKSRSSSKGGVDAVASGDNLGSVSFYGADGTDVNTPAAQIRCEVDGTPGSNDMPGRIIFATTADGAASTTERMRITRSGNIGINSTSPKTDVDISQKTGAVALPQGTTAQRPSGSAPYIRKNTTNNALEYYDGTSWVEIITDYFPTGSTILG